MAHFYKKGDFCGSLSNLDRLNNEMVHFQVFNYFFRYWLKFRKVLSEPPTMEVGGSLELNIPEFGIPVLKLGTFYTVLSQFLSLRLMAYFHKLFV